jgi:propanol-preferring alcohol dehydrogenase
MRAMVIEQLGPVTDGSTPLALRELPRPEPGSEELLIRVTACGVCHTELDEIEGRTAPPRLPVIPGHQVVGVVEQLGPGVTGYAVGDRVGVAWIYSTCGHCEFCREGRENLCPNFRATGRDAAGGYADYMVAPFEFVHALPPSLTDTQIAPLLCAGAVGYRSLRLTGLEDGQRLGLTGFGASAHLVLQTARHQCPNSPVFVFARREEERQFARELGAAWAGDTAQTPPVPLHAIIDTTPAWGPVVAALVCLVDGGRLVINAIRKEDADRNELLKLSYAEHIWREKEIKSVANVTRRDVSEFLEIAAAIPIRPEVTEYPLAEANRAIVELRTRHIRGAKVLRVS